jgi:hypothetical protein
MVGLKYLSTILKHTQKQKNRGKDNTISFNDSQAMLVDREVEKA